MPGLVVGAWNIQMNENPSLISRNVLSREDSYTDSSLAGRERLQAAVMNITNREARNSKGIQGAAG